MEKEEARKQFNEKTKELDIKHTFSFDEAWAYVEYKKAVETISSPREFFPANYTKEEFKTSIQKLESNIRKSGKTLNTIRKVNRHNPLRHSFGDGCYVREVFNPKGELLITKIHKITHPYFLLKGKMSIFTEEGEILLEAPHYGITKAGTKRIIFAHEDCIFVTVHVTDKTDLTEIEEEIISKDFNEPEEV